MSDNIGIDIRHIIAATSQGVTVTVYLDSGAFITYNVDNVAIAHENVAAISAPWARANHLLSNVNGT